MVPHQRPENFPRPEPVVGKMENERLYAIVRFVDEEDAVAIIATNWMTDEGRNCFFPRITNEEKKNKMVMARIAPEDDWLECRIRVIKEFRSYQAARSQLSLAEETSSLESEDGCRKPRKRRQRNIRLPGEESSEETEPQSINKTYPPQAYPPPPPSSLIPSSPVIANSSNYSNYVLHQDLPTSPQYPSSPIQPPPRENISFSPSTSYQIDPQLKSTTSANFSSGSPYANSPTTRNQGFYSDIKSIKNDQRATWAALGDLFESVRRIEFKLDSLITEQKNTSSENSEEDNIISFLPLQMEDFLKLEDDLKKKHKLRQRLMRHLMVVRGREPKTCVSGLLRKLITDETAEKFSLTGKSLKSDTVKMSFEKTSAFKLILEITFRNFKEVKENIVREAVSDWLMQAKFRKNRREKRTEDLGESRE